MLRGGTVVILAAGQGTRMKSARPKVLHEICGRSMLRWVVDRALALEPERVVVVIGHGADSVKQDLLPFGEQVRTVVQEPQLGTGHAVQVAAAELGADPGRLLLLYGDMPLLSHESLVALCEAQAEAGSDGAALLTACVEEPRGFGRILRRGEDLLRIVEEKDASPEERAVREVNLGVYCFGERALSPYLGRLSSDNAQGEFYITDVAGEIVAAGHRVRTLAAADAHEAIGVNTLSHLSEARRALQDRILEQHLDAGVQIEDPATTYIDHGVTIGVGTRILPCTVIRAGVEIGDDCEVGPFTHLRTGTRLDNRAAVGNFTECKKSRVGEGAKAKHLSYLGDTTIGARANIGAGTVFANYDGQDKHETQVGEDAFVGSGTVVVAPAWIGRGATTGAGAVVTGGSRIGDGEVWVGVPAKLLRTGPDREG